MTSPRAARQIQAAGGAANQDIAVIFDLVIVDN